MTKQSAAYDAPEARLSFQPMTALHGPFFEALIHTGQAYAAACLEWQQEVLRFAGSRLQWDGKVGEALAKCRTPSEVVEVQRDWAMSTAQEYFDEANRLAQIATKFVPSWMPSPARHHGVEARPESHAAE